MGPVSLRDLAARGASSHYGLALSKAAGYVAAVSDFLSHRTDADELAARCNAVRAALAGKVNAVLLSQRSCAFGWQTEKDAPYRCAAEVARALAAK